MSEKEQIGKLLELLEQKDFEALSKAEKSYVLQRMTEEEYEQERAVIVSSGAVMPLSVPIEVDRNLKAAFRHQATTQPHWLQRTIPIWQMMLLVGIVAILNGVYIWQMNTEKEVIVPKRETIYVHTTDTVYREIEKQIFVELPVVLEKDNLSKKETTKGEEQENTQIPNRIELSKEAVKKTLSPNNIPTKASSDEVIFAGDVPLNVGDVLINETIAIELKKGKSVADDTTLINYQMKVY